MVLDGDVEEEAGRVGHRFFQGNQLLVIVPIGGVAAQGVHRVVVLQRPERRETQQGINRVAVVVGAIHQMQTGRLVTCILKIAGQREHRLPDQVDIGGTARRQKGHGVAGEGLKLRVGGSAAAGGNKQIAVHGVPDEGIPELQLVGGVIRLAHPHVGQGFVHDHENVGGLCAGAGLGDGVLIQNFLHRGRGIPGGLGGAAILIVFQKGHDHALALKHAGNGPGPVGHGKARHKNSKTEQEGNCHRGGLHQQVCFCVHGGETVPFLLKQKRGPGDEH